MMRGNFSLSLPIVPSAQIGPSRSGQNHVMRTAKSRGLSRYLENAEITYVFGLSDKRVMKCSSLDGHGVFPLSSNLDRFIMSLRLTTILLLAIPALAQQPLWGQCRTSFTR
jgi:hypothetical protein